MSGDAAQAGVPIPRRLTPREFCDGHPRTRVADLRDGDEVVGIFIVHEARRAESRANKPYLRLVLGDATGTIDAFVWDEIERWEAACVAGNVVGIRGRVGSFQDRLQLKVLSVDELEAEPSDFELLLPTSPRPRARMEAELDARIASVRDRGLRKLLYRCVGRGNELGRAFRVHPAAQRNHHGYLAGLLEHSLSVAGSCEQLVEHYREQGVELDRDLLVTAALLHDIGKVRELKPPPLSGYTTEGRLLGHIVIGIQMVAREAETISDLPRDRLLLLQHLIASHQGRPEWDSPRTPQMLEALVLHYADDLDAKLNAARQLLSGVEEGDWSAYDRSFGRAFFRPESATPPEPATEQEPRTPELGFDLFAGEQGAS